MKSKINKQTGEIEFALPVVRHPFQRVRYQTVIEGESMTHQSHAAAADINNIIARFDRTGELPRAKQQGAYGDVTALQGDLTELHSSAVTTIQTANEFVAAKARVKRVVKEEQQSLALSSAPSSSPPPVVPAAQVNS